MRTERGRFAVTLGVTTFLVLLIALSGSATAGQFILTAPGPGSGLGAHIRGFRAGPPGTPGGVIPTATSFLAYPPGMDLGAHVTPCDVDGDGVLDIVTGPGPGAGFGAHVLGFRLDGTPVPGLSFLAYPPGVGFGVKVACGDLDGDGRAEIITGPGPGLASHVRGFTYNPITATVEDVGVSFLAYSAEVDRGVNVAAADLDGDGKAEILTGPGPGPGFGAHVQAFRVTPGTPGGVTDAGVSFLAYSSGVGFGVNVAAADLDGDGKAEILTGPGPGDGLGTHVRAFRVTPGTPGGVTDAGVSFLAYPGVGYGMSYGGGGLPPPPPLPPAPIDNGCADACCGCWDY